MSEKRRVRRGESGDGIEGSMAREEEQTFSRMFASIQGGAEDRQRTA